MLVLRPFMLELVVRSMMLCLWGATALVGQCVSIICACVNYYYMAVFVSPEIIVRPPWRNIFQTTFFKKNLVMVAVDEAHCIPEWLD